MIVELLILFTIFCILTLEVFFNSLNLLLFKSFLYLFPCLHKILRIKVSLPARPPKCLKDFNFQIAKLGYDSIDHHVKTEDGFCLVIHQLCSKLSENSTLPIEKQSLLNSDSCSHTKDKQSCNRKPVVLLWHGLMMNSEMFVIDRQTSLAVTLLEEGFDVWIGNTRGNKYSWMHSFKNRSQTSYWDFSIDELATYDIPAVIKYILRQSNSKSISFLGYSNGSAQIFAALARSSFLCQKINLVIALAPACKILRLHKEKESTFLFNTIFTNYKIFSCIFGKKAMLGSVPFIKRMLPGKIYAYLIQFATYLLFGWTYPNVKRKRLISIFSRIYSTTSTKIVFHWFQMLKSNEFEYCNIESSLAPDILCVPKYDLRNILTPVILLCGKQDFLCDSNFIMNLVPNCTFYSLSNYHHLDLLIADDVSTKVFPIIVRALKNIN